MRTTLLPFAAEVVPEVDVDAGRMEVGAQRLGLAAARATFGPSGAS
jgi:ribosomal 30S subunit maturation factor RimM